MNVEEYLSRYRPNIGIVLFNRRAQVWIGQRVADFSDVAGLSTQKNVWRWQFPQGGIDRDERYEEAAFRELREETGVSSARLLAMTPGWLVYDFPPEYKKKAWDGQRQKWAAMLFEGEDSEIDIAADDHQEFDAWRWTELEEATELIVPFKRGIYEEVVRSFSPLRDFLRDCR